MLRMNKAMFRRKKKTPRVSRPRKRKGTVHRLCQLVSGPNATLGVYVPSYSTLASPPVAIVMVKNVHV